MAFGYALSDVPNYLLARRLKTQLSATACDYGRSEGTLADIKDLAERQLAAWRSARIDADDMVDGFRKLNAVSRSVFVYRCSAARVATWSKPEIAAAGVPRQVARRQDTLYRRRSALYRILIEAALSRTMIDAPFLLAIDVNDRSLEKTNCPLFAFQKIGGEKTILLPDVDFINWSWYEGVNDPVEWPDKLDMACFVGSSTGAYLNEEAILASATPRLRAASYFAGRSDVLFRIAAAEQCESSRAEALLRNQPYFGPPMTWAEQFRHRFLLSMDGNGAACSRFAIALKSNSVPIKFSSPSILYYYPALRA